MSFLQSGTPTPGVNGLTHKHIKCYNYNSAGHYASSCLTAVQDGHQMLQLGAPTMDPSDSYQSKFSFARRTEHHPTHVDTFG